ncbi:MAG TPA: ABC transporter permease [Puia sp.]|nr:ABC transporter permease [Puia sp.]
MRLPVNFRIAGVQLLSRRRQTLIAMLGVMFGIAMFIFMISFMNGVNKIIQDIMLSVTPDIHLYNDLRTDYRSSVTSRFYEEDSSRWIIVRHPRPRQTNINLKDAPGIISGLRGYPGVLAVSPLVSVQILFNYGPVQLGVVADGVDMREEDRLFDLSGKMISGRPRDLLTIENGILLGKKLAEKLHVMMGDIVTATASSGAQMQFRVVGIFEFGLSQVDEGKVYISLPNMQQLLGRNRDYITDIRIKLKDLGQAKALAAVFTKKYGYRADDWETVNASVKAGNLIRDTLTYVVSFTMLLVAGFGIYNIMNMVILGKMKDIAILKAQGFDRRDITQIFLSQSLSIGVAGGVAGLLLGFGLSYGLSRMPFPTDEYMLIKFYPVTFEAKHYLLGAGFGLLTTFLAGWLPARKASRVDPVAILRT